MKNKTKRIVDVLMVIAILFLMAYQVTGEVAHEYIGILMVGFVIVHQILNRRWYGAILRGRYNLYRFFNTIINIMLLVAFILTALSGMAMSNYAVPFLYSIINVSTARVMHLAFSYWAFILMGIHLGFHINVMTYTISKKIKIVLYIIMVLFAMYGLYVFIKSGIINYITFKSQFAYFNYDKSIILIFLENFSLLSLFVFMGYHFCRVVVFKDGK